MNEIKPRITSKVQINQRMTQHLHPVPTTPVFIQVPLLSNYLLKPRFSFSSTGSFNAGL
jgi:hypothetical protein